MWWKSMNAEAEPNVGLLNHGEPSWAELVERVRSGEPSALEELYKVLSKGIRFYLCRQIGRQDLDDKVHDLFLIIVQAIQKGDLREPNRLMGYVRTIVRRQVSAHIDGVVQARRNQTDVEYGLGLSDYRPNPERRVIDEQNITLAMGILKSLHKREREVLMRFYLKEQTADQICNEMELTETQFRLIKSRAKARFGELGKKRLEQRPHATASFCPA
jgi:RNA polymerase sigma factor (sigma-70 family)